MKPCDSYRDMIRQSLVFLRGATDEDILRILDKTWEESGDPAHPRGWTDDERAVLRIWSGLGFLIFGRLDKLEETLALVVEKPDALNEKPCRYFASAVWNLVPFPRTLRGPQARLDWLREHGAHLWWDEALGVFAG